MISSIGRDGFLIRMIYWVVPLYLLLGCLFGCDAPKTQQTSSNRTEVVALTLKPKNVSMTPGFVAEVKSSHQVDIVARVSGFLDRIAYKEGSLVNVGDELFKIDPKPFQAQLAAEMAELERSNAEIWIAKANLNRIQPLAQKNAASKSDLDNAIGRVRTAETMLAQAKARVEKAKLDLSYTTIQSPIRGIAGTALVREGTFLASGTPNAKLTSVTMMDPIWVEFSVTQNQHLKMRNEVARGSIVSPESKAYEIEVEFNDGQRYAHTGRFIFADPTFDPATGTYQVRVQLPNPEGQLIPGMFVRARIKGAFRPDAIVVPQKAVQQTAKGHIVYIVNKENQAEIRPVRVGDWVGQDWIIDEGLQAGDRLIIDGFQRLAPGAPVQIQNANSPDAPATPVERK